MKLRNTLVNFIRKHGGTVLAVAASAGVALTVYEACKTTAKVTEDARDNFVPTSKEKAKIELAQTYWKNYIPTAIIGSGTIACILGANALSRKQIASLSAAYLALGKSYQQLRSTLAHRATDESIKQIRDFYNQDTVEVAKAKSSEEKLLCYDSISKRYFHATMADLLDAFYEVNRDFALTGEVPLNNLYSYLPELDFIPEGDTKGWNYDYMSCEFEYYWIDFLYDKRKTADGQEYYYIWAAQEPIDKFTEDYYETYMH